MADTFPSKSGLIGLYLRNFAANIAGNLTIVLLNLFTPLEVFKDWQSFFMVDDYSRSKLMPLLFPEGKLAATSGAVKISILRRIRVLYGAGTGAPVLILVGTLALVLWEMEDKLVSAVGFGKDKIQHIIRQNHEAGADEILTICFNTLNRFLETRAPEDDVTMIVIKLIDD